MVWCVLCKKIFPGPLMKAIGNGWVMSQTSTPQGPWKFCLCPECSNRRDEAILRIKQMLNHKHETTVLDIKRIRWIKRKYPKEQCPICFSMKWDSYDSCIKEQEKIDDWLTQ